MNERHDQLRGACSESCGDDRITVRIPGAIAMTGISRTKLYELIKAREIEIIKVGSATLVVVASLRRFVERRRPA